MFTINEYSQKFKIYELRDEEANSWIKVCPERGGIITSFGANGQENLYLNGNTFCDKSKNIRGGIPILFPLCGQLPEQKYVFDGQEYSMKNHGLARTAEWKVIDKDTQNNASIKLSFASSTETLKSYPFEFELIFEYILKGNKLTINQFYINHSDKSMPMSAGFHPYFFAKDKKSVEYFFNASEYLDCEDLKIKAYNSEDMDLTHSKESKLILDHKGNSLSFYLRDLNRKVSFDYSSQFKYIILWSVPGSNFICVEPWTSKAAALSSKEDLLYISPGDSLNLNYTITVEQSVYL